MKVRQIAYTTFLAAILWLVKISLASVPNVEMVTLLVIVYGATLPFKIGYPAVAIYVILDSMIFGFGDWVPALFIIWSLYFWVAAILKRWLFKSWHWAIVSAFFGIIFGSLFSIYYYFLYGTLSLIYLIQGLPYDLIHAVSNFFIALILFEPVSKVLKKLVIDKLEIY